MCFSYPVWDQIISVYWFFWVCVAEFISHSLKSDVAPVCSCLGLTASDQINTHVKKTRCRVRGSNHFNFIVLTANSFDRIALDLSRSRDKSWFLHCCSGMLFHPPPIMSVKKTKKQASYIILFFSFLLKIKYVEISSNLLPSSIKQSRFSRCPVGFIFHEMKCFFMSHRRQIKFYLHQHKSHIFHPRRKQQPMSQYL